jgi:hypothetical protein
MRPLFSSDGPMIRPEAYQFVDDAPKGTKFFTIIISPDPEKEDTHKDLDMRQIECVPPFTRGIMGHEIGLVLARELRLLVPGHPLPLSSPQRIQWHVCGRRRGQDGHYGADAV